MSAKDQIKQIVDFFKKEPQLKDKTDGMAEGLLLGAQLADDANELSKETDASFKTLQREYTENGNGSQTTAEITVARDGELVLDDRLKRDFGNVNAQLAQTENEIDWISVKNFGAYGNQIADDTEAIKQAINYARENNIYKIVFPSGTYIMTEDLVLPPGMAFVGSGYAKETVRFYYTGEGWCIRTGSLFGEHRRNTLIGIEIYLKSTIAKGAIMIGDENDDTVIPVQHYLQRITIQDISPGQIGIYLKNASGIQMDSVLSNRGTGGTGLLIEPSRNNSGVMVFNNCSFGGHNQNDIGMELRHGTGSIDGLTFNACYFGGKKPILISGSSAVKNIVLNSPHFEPTTQDEEFYAMDINSVVGLTINSVTFYGKNSDKFVAMIFRGISRGVTVNGVDANEFNNGVVYKNVSPETLRNSILQHATPTGLDRTVIQTVGDFTSCLIVEANAISQNVVKISGHLSYTATGNKVNYGTSAPTAGGNNRGDFRHNSSPAELGTAGSKYVILGWSCVGSGSPGTWIECRALTGN